jgi:SAM-dependent methyltransferase
MGRVAEAMADNILPFPSRVAAARGCDDLEWNTQRHDASSIVELLATGVCPPDLAFDAFLPEPLRKLSAQHWTPLTVAVRAARWFDECNVRTVVDIGSGPGKFCVAAALGCHCHFTGLEHRERLVACARMLASSFGVKSQVHFICGALGEARLPSADAYYLYNPFEENVMGRTERIDDDVELGNERLTRDLQTTHALLARAPAGTYLLTYNGFGGRIPASYRQVRADRDLPNPLCLWRKAASRLFAGARTGTTASSGAA